MSAENKTPVTIATDPQPAAIRAHDPKSTIWIFVLTLLLVFIGGLAFDQTSGWFQPQVYGPYASVDQLEMYQPKSGAAAALAHGKVVYEQVCGLCHGTDGLGKPGQAPPLAGSEWVNCAGFNRSAHIPLMGINGELQVEGKSWNMAMAAMGAGLSDEDLAEVLTYIRGSWGNKAGEVTADDIHKIRSGMAANVPPMSGDQIKTMPE
jgi:mono/diheme cytochrome c family protein